MFLGVAGDFPNLLAVLRRRFLDHEAGGLERAGGVGRRHRRGGRRGRRGAGRRGRGAHLDDLLTAPCNLRLSMLGRPGVVGVRQVAGFGLFLTGRGAQVGLLGRQAGTPGGGIVALGGAQGIGDLVAQSVGRVHPADAIRPGRNVDIRHHGRRGRLAFGLQRGRVNVVERHAGIGLDAVARAVLDTLVAAIDAAVIESNRGNPRHARRKPGHDGMTARQILLVVVAADDHARTSRVFLHRRRVALGFLLGDFGAFLHLFLGDFELAHGRRVLCRHGR